MSDSGSDRRPLLVGVGDAVGRPGDPGAPDALGWMQRAVEAALGDAVLAVQVSEEGRPPGGRAAVTGTAAEEARTRLAASIGWIGVPEGTWSCDDAGTALARRLGLGSTDARPVSVRADVGMLQTTLVAEAAKVVASGSVDAALVVGGEARAAERARAKAGLDAFEPVAVGRESDVVLRPEGDVLSGIELERHLATPATEYAIIEDALAHADGLDRVASEQRMAELWASFATVAARRASAWDRSAPTAEALLAPDGGNRLVATPYRRGMCSQWNVDAAAAVIVASAECCASLGLDRDPTRWVAIETVADSNLMVPLPERGELHRWPAAEAVADALAERCDEGDRSPCAFDVVDLYACFPSAVQVQARAFDLPLDGRLTVTGGMTFGGGPLNNAALASLVEVVRSVRSFDRPARGLVTAVSGMLTKAGALTVVTDDGTDRFGAVDVTDEATRRTTRLPVDPALAGPGVIDGATVLTTIDGVERAVAVATVSGEDGPVRTVASSVAPEVVAVLASEGGAGRAVLLDGDGGFSLDDD